MSIDYAREYIKAMDMLRAREILQDNGVALWPNLKPDNRRKYHKDLMKRAGYLSNNRVATASDLRRILGNDNG